ncbi:MAG: cation:proton antiporter, partial [Thermoplasmata archaeon]|nr:cation:proton antiporter [Thermoplasmata archaeon]
FLKRERMPLSATILLGFGLALLARPFGLHEAIGAYIAGLIIGKWGAQLGPMLKRRRVWEKLVSDLDPTLRAIFSPLFFGYVGLVFVQLLAPSFQDIGIMVVVLGVVLLGLALLGKLVGCGGASLFLGFTKKEGMVIGAGMMGRGAVEMVLLLYGKEAGILTDAQFSAVLVVILATTVVTPLAYSWASKKEKKSRRIRR